MNLKGVNAGSSAKVIKVGGEGAYRQHLLDMGIIPGTILTVVKYAPMGDPVEIRIHSYELTLRLDDMNMIEVEPV
ncbi:MAG: ferrous iron transport protein A, partial [Lachnospiraceae bacterium]|nr:ferrous iron transport protein A [Lachnospiraceae bacterium]